MSLKAIRQRQAMLDKELEAEVKLMLAEMQGNPQHARVNLLYAAIHGIVLEIAEGTTVLSQRHTRGEAGRQRKFKPLLRSTKGLELEQRDDSELAREYDQTLGSI